MSTQARVATSMDAFITVCPFCCARSSTHTLIRSAWIILHTTSYVYLSVRLYLSLVWHRTSRTFHNKQYTLTTVMKIKSFGTCATSGGRSGSFETCLHGFQEMSSAFTMGFGLPPLARRLDPLLLQCDGSHGLCHQALAVTAFSNV